MVTCSCHALAHSCQSAVYCDPTYFLALFCVALYTSHLHAYIIMHDLLRLKPDCCALLPIPGRDFTLRIATELHLKRLVVGGFERVFELGRIFRWAPYRLVAQSEDGSSKCTTPGM